jgi:trans-2,3-dihydro-3-hydroxyanthranilate isomerase
MAPPKPTFGERFPAERAARMLRLTVADLDPQLPAQLVSIGPKFVFIGVRDLAALRRARLDEEFFHACRAEGLPISSVFLFSPQAYSSDAHYAARLFFDANGVREDPATGSANSGFAAYLHAHLKNPIDVIVEQGFEIRRRSRLYLRADAQQLRVGGRVKAVSEGRLLDQ